MSHFYKYHFLPSEETHFGVYAFDKDHTITPANKEIQPDMIDALVEIMRSKVVVILTARDIHTCHDHIINPIRNHLGERRFQVIQPNLILGCSNGSQIFQFQENTQKYELTSQLEGQIAPKETFEKLLPKMAEAMNVDVHKMHFEPRSATMGTFVCIPRNSSEEERKNFDPDKTRRKKAIESIKDELPLLPEGKNYEILPAGSTSIDIGLHDKAAGMLHLINTLGYTKKCGEIIFFGDGFDGGNDTCVAEVPEITVIQVQNPENTKEILDMLSKAT